MKNFEMFNLHVKYVKNKNKILFSKRCNYNVNENIEHKFFELKSSM